jgi:hypothetical protein
MGALGLVHAACFAVRDAKLSGPARGVYAPLAYCIVNVLSMAFLYGHAERSTSKNCGFRP